MSPAAPSRGEARRRRVARRFPGHLADEAAYTLVEVLIVTAIIGLLANVAVPLMYVAIDKADATRLLTDLDVIGDAARQYRIDNGSYPSTGRWRLPPARLASYLPPDFRFEYKQYWYLWLVFGDRVTVLVFNAEGGSNEALQRAVDGYSGDVLNFGRFALFYVETDT